MIEPNQNENNTLSKSQKIALYIGLISSGVYILIVSIISLSLATLTYLKLIIIMSGVFLALSAMISIDKDKSYLQNIIIGIGFITVVIGASLLRDIFFIVFREYDICNSSTLSSKYFFFYSSNR